MSRVLMFVVFISMVTLVALSVHLYLYRRLVVRMELPRKWRRAGTIALAVLGTGLLLSLMLSRQLPPRVARIIACPFYIWIAPMMLLFVTLLVVDLGRLGVWLARKLRPPAAEPDAKRRLFLARAVTGVCTGTVLSAVGIGLAHALGTLVVRRVQVPLRRLPPALDGFTIAQITDLHLGPTRGGDWMAEVVDRVNALGADLIAVTGDLVDGSVASLAADVAPLGRLRAPHGVYFVTGNHEYYSGVAEWLAEVQRLGLRVLRNERVSIGKGDASFDLAGVDDIRSEGLAPGHKHDVAAAVRGRDEKRELVLLAHQPLSIFEAAAHGVGLLIAGHTHGGQIWPVQPISRLINKYVAGLHKHGPTWIYVSSGTGFWGPPVRIFSTAEIALLTLKAA